MILKFIGLFEDILQIFIVKTEEFIFFNIKIVILAEDGENLV